MKTLVSVQYPCMFLSVLLVSYSSLSLFVCIVFVCSQNAFGIQINCTTIYTLNKKETYIQSKYACIVWLLPYFDAMGCLIRSIRWFYRPLCRFGFIQWNVLCILCARGLHFSHKKYKIYFIYFIFNSSRKWKKSKMQKN